MSFSDFYNALNNVLLHFPDPFETPDFKSKPDSKNLVVIEHRLIRKKMDKVLHQLHKLLKLQLDTSEVQLIKQHWKQLAILKTYYLKRFELSAHNDYHAFFLLKQLIMEYDFFLKEINRRV